MKGTAKGGGAGLCSRFLNPRGLDYRGAWNRIIKTRRLACLASRTCKSLGSEAARRERRRKREKIALEMLLLLLL